LGCHCAEGACSVRTVWNGNEECDVEIKAHKHNKQDRQQSKQATIEVVDTLSELSVNVSRGYQRLIVAGDVVSGVHRTSYSCKKSAPGND